VSSTPPSAKLAVSWSPIAGRGITETLFRGTIALAAKKQDMESEFLIREISSAEIAAHAESLVDHV